MRWLRDNASHRCTFDRSTRRSYRIDRDFIIIEYAQTRVLIIAKRYAIRLRIARSYYMIYSYARLYSHYKNLKLTWKYGIRYNNNITYLLVPTSTYGYAYTLHRLIRFNSQHWKTSFAASQSESCVCECVWVRVST